jgi:hypothetical protein
MNIRDINKPITSKTLNETLARKFGTRLDTDSFTLEQLQDARNKVRTKLSQIETNESFGGLPKNETYSKNKLFLDILNAAISERADVDVNEGEMPAGLKKHMEKKGKKGIKGGPKDHGKRPDSPDLDNDGDTDEPIAQAAKQAKKESIVREGAEDKAELVMAAKDMVDRLTGWMEDTAEMQSESMLELADAIRDEMSQQDSDSFVNTVKPALEQLYAAMETTRESLTAGVSMLTGEGDMPAPDMGAPIDDIPADVEPEMEPTMDDEFGAAAPAAGGTEEAGRARRESKYYKKKAMLEQARRLGTILSKKKSDRG